MKISPVLISLGVILPSIIGGGISAATVSDGEAQPRPLILHYDRPAGYFEEALVIGNGSQGAIVYGGTKTDRISLNDITLWTGEPEGEAWTPDAWKALPEVRELLDAEDYAGADEANKKIQGHFSENYQPLGWLEIEYPGREEAAITGYYRELDIRNAVASSRYEVDGKLFATEYFASAPDSVIVVRLNSASPEGINARLKFSSLVPHSVSAAGDCMTATGYVAYESFPSYYNGADEMLQYDPARGTRFTAMVRVLASDGKVSAAGDGSLDIEGAPEAVVVIALATSFNGFDKDPAKEGRDHGALAASRLEGAVVKAYDDLKAAHVADYRHFFDRVELDLGRTDDALAALPTDRQLWLYTEEGQANPELEVLYFQYGRYLLISCSRTPGVPANLQGLWNEYILPPWSSNYTVNINLEENYWPAEVLNLTEMHDSMLEFVRNLSQTGQVSAKAYYGVDKGWSLSHNSDIWAMTCPVGLNTGDPCWANWNMGGAWVSTHIWERYMFTQDKDFLEEYWPVLKGAAEFCLDWLIEKDGWLMTSPGTSPENKFVTPEGYAGATSYGNTSDLAMIRECLLDARAAAKELGVDKDFCKRVDKTLPRLLPYRVGERGNLMEWYHDWPDQEPWHRHQSHLFGLYPGHHLSVEETPDLTAACAKTLELKGDETTGWSTGWRVNIQARLKDADRAYSIYRRLLRYVSPDNYQGEDARRGGGTYPNLLDAHAPFQIDGNFGGCAGVAEMLMQSTPDRIELLPALPEQWSEGSVSGLCARGGFVVGMSWKDGKVCSYKISSKKGGKTTLAFNGKTRKINLKPGQTVTVRWTVFE